MLRFHRVAATLVAAAFTALGLAGGAIRAQGGPALRVGSDISYAPVEFYAQKKPHGLDVDLGDAIAKRMNSRAQFINHDFNTIVPALQSRKFDVVMSAMSDTREREKLVAFVDYFLAGSGILVAKGNPAHISALNDLCGRTADLQTGTSQEKMLHAISDGCKALGLRGVTILAYPTDDQALKALVAGKSDAHISDFPVVAYLAEAYDKEFDVVGKQFNIAPYGIAVPKSNPQLREAIRRALAQTIADGTYDKILQKWNLEIGAMRSTPVNAGRLYSNS
ncbi:MAG: ABC transporter substrate-binding protein [Candidatus Eremiobacteraeota bacterium]|nr:ABC transporter substrate-binding protein [Candidatus Eremiobacteraeota bacterium]